MKSLRYFVIPAHAGIQVPTYMDSRFRGNDGRFRVIGNPALDSNNNIYIPSPEFCTDNAAMIAHVGGRQIEMGMKENLGLGASSRL